MSKKAARKVTRKEINNALQDEEILQFEKWYPHHLIKDYDDYLKKKEEEELEDRIYFMETIQRMINEEDEFLNNLF